MARRGPGESDVDIGARIRLRRKALSFTQSQLAEALGVTFQQVQKYERGSNRVAATTLVGIAAKLDCPVSFLLGASGGGGPDPIPPAVLVRPGATDLLQSFERIGCDRARAALLNLAKILQAHAERELKAAA